MVEGYSVYKSRRKRENIQLDGDEAEKALALLYAYHGSKLVKKNTRKKK